VSNGPYTLSEWTFKRKARLRVNPFYRQAEEIRCRTVDMLEYDNVSAALMAFDAGDVDFLTDLSVPFQHELYRRMQEGERKDLKTCSTMSTYFFNFNCASPQVGGRENPFVDARVRRAFTLATDRTSLANNVRRLGDRPAYSLVPPGAMAAYAPPTGLPFDASAARELLKDTGYASGAELGPVDLLFPPRQAVVCQALARMWEENLGVQVELRSLESKTFAEEKANQACMPCHQDKVENSTAHTHHKPDSAGNKCVSCHMPMTEFARMRRSDHSMLPPTPAATTATFVPIKIPAWRVAALVHPSKAVGSATTSMIARIRMSVRWMRASRDSATGPRSMAPIPAANPAPAN